jgi:hypothetical protein
MRAHAATPTAPQTACDCDPPFSYSRQSANSEIQAAVAAEETDAKQQQ